jgi:uncharacterized protein (TIRG00374 family)
MALKSRKALFAALVIFVAGCVLYYFRGNLHLSQFSGAKLWASVRGANFLDLFLATVGIYVCYALRALRWHNFQLQVGQSKFWDIYALHLAGFSAVYLFGRFGEPVRPLLISRKEKAPLADTFGIYALERVLDLGFAVMLLASWFLIVTIQKGLHPQEASTALENARKTAGTILSAALIVAVVVAVYVRLHGASMLEGRMKTWISGHGWRASVARIFLGVLRGLKTIRSWRDLLVALTISGLHWFLIIVIYHLIAHAFGGNLARLRFQDSLLVLALTLVGSLFQLPGIGGGPQAVIIGAYTKLFSIAVEPATAAAMLIYLITFAACSFAGVPLLFREGWSFGELKRMREHEAEEIDAEITEHSAKPA